jgi:CheY-like chemotaxis protein
MMRLGKLSDARRAHAFEVIERNARAQAQLVEDLLDISRIVSGRLRLEVRQTDPREVLRASLEAVRPAVQAKGIRLEVDAESVGELLADPDRLQQVAWNLLSNAIKFTPTEGTVTARLRRDGGGISLRVEDTGQGIPGEFLPYVFDRFRQADASSKRVHGGLGLGLAISRHLMELHGGTLEAHSEGAAKGATFVARFPVRALPAERRASPQAPPSRGPSRTLEGLRVLVVDDELDTREMIGTLLMDESASGHLAGSVAEAVRLLERERVDLLISDLAMPGEDGYALIARLRGLPRGSEVPAIALTGHARAEVRAEVMRAGFDLHLPKPVDPEELLQVVSRLVRADA